MDFPYSSADAHWLKNLVRLPYWLSASTVGILSILGMAHYSEGVASASLGAYCWFVAFTVITTLQIPIHLGLLMPLRLSCPFFNKVTTTHQKFSSLFPHPFYNHSLPICNTALFMLSLINIPLLLVHVRPFVVEHKIQFGFFIHFLVGSCIHLCVLLLRGLAHMLGTTKSWFNLAWDLELRTDRTYEAN